MRNRVLATVIAALLGANVQRYPPNAAEAALHVIADPNIALLLLSLITLNHVLRPRP